MSALCGRFLFLEADGVEPTGEGECHDALSEGVVKCYEAALADPKGVELPLGILPLLAFPDDLCIRAKFQQVIEDCSQTLQQSLRASHEWW